MGAADLVFDHSPVRNGFLERTRFSTICRSVAGETGLSLALTALGTPDSQWRALDVDAPIYLTSIFTEHEGQK